MRRIVRIASTGRHAAGGTRCSVLLPTLLAGLLAAADPPSGTHLSFDEPETTTPESAGPREANAAVKCERFDEWYPILRSDGVQVKNIVDGSPQVLAESERPIVLDLGTDVEIDHAGGRFKAKSGGRYELGQIATISLKYTNPGPARVQGKVGQGLQFDGIDDTFAIPAASRANPVTVSMWISLPDDCPDAAAILSQAGRPVLLVKDVPGLSRNTWHHVAATFDPACVRLVLDDAPLANALPARTLTSEPLFLGGAQDPCFFKGIIDEVEVK